LSAAAITAAITAAFGVARWVEHFVSNPYEEDFRLNYVAAQIGLSHGWSHIYDLDLERQFTARFAPVGVAIDSYHNYVTPPLLAWLLAPFTLIPLPAGLLVWTFLSLAALVAAWWLLERERWAPAGAVMALAMFIKPQLLLLLPVALLASGRWRPVVYFALASAILGVISLISLGQHGVDSYFSSVNFTRGNPIHSVLTFTWFGRGPVATGMELTAGLVALALAWYRRDRMDLVFALGIVGSTASAFYLHEYDAAVFVLPAWIVLRSRPSVPQRAWLLIGVVAAQLIAIGVFRPMVLWEAGWIGMLGAEPWLAGQLPKMRPLGYYRSAIKPAR